MQGYRLLLSLPLCTHLIRYSKMSNLISGWTFLSSVILGLLLERPNSACEWISGWFCVHVYRFTIGMWPSNLCCCSFCVEVMQMKSLSFWWYCCVKFISSYAQESPYMLLPISQKFSQCCLWNFPNVGLSNNAYFSSFHGTSLSASGDWWFDVLVGFFWVHRLCFKFLNTSDLSRY